MDSDFYNISFVISLIGKPGRAVHYPNRHKNGVDVSGLPGEIGRPGDRCRGEDPGHAGVREANGWVSAGNCGCPAATGPGIRWCIETTGGRQAPRLERRHGGDEGGEDGVQ